MNHLVNDARPIGRWLRVIIATTGLFVMLATLSLHMAARSAYFHQLNIMHLTYAAELRQALEIDLGTPGGLDIVSTKIERIMDQPRACLESIDFLDRTLMRLTGTEVAIQLCIDDIAVGNVALEHLEAYKEGAISQKVLTNNLLHAIERFSDHSARFEVGVTKMIDFTLRYFIPALLTLGLIVIAATAFASRGIARTVSEVIRSREALQQTEERLSITIDSLSDPFALWDADDRLMVHNERYRSVNHHIATDLTTGTKFETLLRQQVTARLLPQAWGREEEYIAERLESRKAPSGPFELQMNNGIWLLVRESPIPGGGIATVASDITDLKRAQNELAMRRTELTIALENMPHGLCLFDRDLKFVEVNPEFRKLYGFPDGYFDTRRRLPEAHEWLVANGQFIGLDEEDARQLASERGGDVYLGRGSGLHHLTSGRVVEVAFGDWTNDMIVGVYTDVTERKRAEAALEATRQELEDRVEKRTRELSDRRFELTQRVRELNCLYTVSRLASNPSLGLSEFGRQTCEAMPWGWQYPELAAVRMSISDIQFTTPGFAETEWRMATVLKSGDATLGMLEVFYTEKMPEADEGPFLTQERDLLEEIANRVADAIARRRNEQALKTAKNAAEAANKAKSTFLSAISHEIRTPMNGILGMIDLLYQTRMDANQNRMLATTRDSAQALLRIIDDVLDFSKVEAGKLEIEETPFRVADVVESASETLAPLAAEKGLDLITFVDPRIPELVQGDGLRLRQILLNLGNNAIKFTAEGEVVLCADMMHKPDDQCWVRFRVMDQGIGLEQHQIPRLFEPFTQAELSTTRRFGGTGLGLSISSRLARLMGGVMSARSKLGAGAVFRAEIPFTTVPSEGPKRGCVVNDLDGVSVVLAGFTTRRMGFLRRYLRHWKVDVACARRMSDLENPAFQDAARAAPIIVAGPDWGNSSAAELMALIDQSGNGKPARVVWTGDETLPGLPLDPETTVRTTPAQRAQFLTAVAVAAGRASPELPRTEIEPLSAEDPAADTTQIKSDAQLLVAEDNAINRDVISRQLTNLGYQFTMCNDGAEALEVWNSEDFDLILTDCHMPNMDGFELTKAIRTGTKRDGKKVPIIAVTANALQGEAERCLAAGMSAYLSKPLSSKVLAKTLIQWLGADKAATPRTEKPGIVEAVPPTPLDGPYRIPARGPETVSAESGEDAGGTLEGAVNGNQVVDLSILQDMLGDGPEVWQFLEKFAATSTTQAADIGMAIRVGSAREVAEAAHKLKSGARSVGAVEVAEVCQRIEAAGKAGDIKRLEKLIPGLKMSVDVFKAFVEHERRP